MKVTRKFLKKKKKKKPPSSAFWCRHEVNLLLAWLDVCDVQHTFEERSDDELGDITSSNTTGSLSNTTLSMIVGLCVSLSKGLLISAEACRGGGGKKDLGKMQGEEDWGIRGRAGESMWHLPKQSQSGSFQACWLAYFSHARTGHKQLRTRTEEKQNRRT
jgi:hypothetical protein